MAACWEANRLKEGTDTVVMSGYDYGEKVLRREVASCMWRCCRESRKVLGLWQMHCMAADLMVGGYRAW